MRRSLEIELTKEFNMGDVICFQKDYENRQFRFFEATEYDVKNLSNKGAWFYKISDKKLQI